MGWFNKKPDRSWLTEVDRAAAKSLKEDFDKAVFKVMEKAKGYAFNTPYNLDSSDNLKSMLYAVRDLKDVKRRIQAFKEQFKYHDDLFGWSWCLTDYAERKYLDKLSETLDGEW
jgi:hypothetical protein